MSSHPSRCTLQNRAGSRAAAVCNRVHQRHFLVKYRVWGAGCSSCTVPSNLRPAIVATWTPSGLSPSTFAPSSHVRHGGWWTKSKVFASHPSLRGCRWTVLVFHTPLPSRITNSPDLSVTPPSYALRQRRQLPKCSSNLLPYPHHRLADADAKGCRFLSFVPVARCLTVHTDLEPMEWNTRVLDDTAHQRVIVRVAATSLLFQRTEEHPRLPRY